MEYKNSIEVTGRTFKVKHYTFRDGEQVTSFSLSVYNGKKADGSYNESMWFKCRCVGDRAILEGETVTVKGRVYLEVWNTDEGVQRKDFAIRVADLQHERKQGPKKSLDNVGYPDDEIPF